MQRTVIELRVYHGMSKTACVAIKVSDELYRELTQEVELSDKPMSLLIASPSLYGGNGDAISIREKVFKMRKHYARELAESITKALVEHFGMNDVTDGYKNVGCPHPTMPQPETNCPNLSPEAQAKLDQENKEAYSHYSKRYGWGGHDQVTRDEFDQEAM